MVRPLFEHELSALFRAGGANDRHAGGAGELHGRNAHAPTGAVDEYTLAGEGTRTLEQGVIRLPIRHIDGRPLGIRGLRGEWMYARRRAQGLFGIGAADRSRDIHPVANRHLADLWANGLDHPGPVVARRVGRGRFGVNSRANISFDRINPDGMHTHYHLASSRLWIRHLFELHDLRLTKRMDANRFHRA